MENMGTQKRYTFTCGRWLAEDEDDGEIVRELPAEGDDIKKVQPGEESVFIISSRRIVFSVTNHYKKRSND